jgi:hypothetical protein
MTTPRAFLMAAAFGAWESTNASSISMSCLQLTGNEFDNLGPVPPEKSCTKTTAMQD